MMAFLFWLLVYLTAGVASTAVMLYFDWTRISAMSTDMINKAEAAGITGNGFRRSMWIGFIVYATVTWPLTVAYYVLRWLGRTRD